MKKIPVIFERVHDSKGNLILTESFTEDFKKALASHFNSSAPLTATIKRDGTAVKMVLEDSGEKTFLARRRVAAGKAFPSSFILEETDPKTGHSFGWEPIEVSPFFKFFKKALENTDQALLTETATFELAGPKINGNPEGLEDYILFKHGSETFEGLDFKTLGTLSETEAYAYLKSIFEGFKESSVEGLVLWSAEKGATAKPAFKIRVKDFFPELDGRFKK